MTSVSGRMVNVGDLWHHWSPLGVIDATFDQLIVIKCAGPHKHALRTVKIIDSNKILALLPPTVAIFIQVLSVTLLLSLVCVTALSRQRTHCCCHTIHSAMTHSSCTHSFRVGRTLKSSHWFVVVTVLMSVTTTNLLWCSFWHDVLTSLLSENMILMQMFPASLSLHN